MNRFALDVFAVLIFDSAFFAFAWFTARRAGLAPLVRSRNAMAVLLLGFTCQLLLGLSCSDLGFTLAFIACMAAVTVCAATDIATGYVFDTVTFPAVAVSLLIAASFHQLSTALVGAATAGGGMGALYALTRGRGLGFGDVKLACCIGAGIGNSNALLSIGAAFVLGGVYAAYLLAMKRGSRGDELRFAPYMAAGMAAVAFYRMAV